MARVHRAFFRATIVGIGLAASPFVAAAEDVDVKGCGKYLYAYDPINKYVGSNTVQETPGQSATFRSGASDIPPNPAFASSEEDLVNNLLYAIDHVPDRPSKHIHILALSGGGQWGAYGAGFLRGWSDSSFGVRRQDMDIITGVSTGAMQTTLAYAGSLADDIITPAPENKRFSADAIRKKADQDLERSYLDPAIAKLISNTFGVFGAVLGNSYYSVEGLEKAVADGVNANYTTMKYTNRRQRAYVGLVNLQRNEFYVADLKALIDNTKRNFSTHQQIKACLSQLILGSAAIPIGFPPRYIDGDMFVDGGTRSALFATILLTHPKVRQRIQARGLTPFVHVIINGNMTANNYARVPAARAKMENSLLPIAKAAMHNAIDQLYRDSVYRNELDLRDAYPNGHDSEYTFIPNDLIRQSAHAECKRSVAEQSEEVFDPVFMKCLYKIGYERGKAQIWDPFKDVPAAPPPPAAVSSPAAPPPPTAH